MHIQDPLHTHICAYIFVYMHIYIYMEAVKCLQPQTPAPRHLKRQPYTHTQFLAFKAAPLSPHAAVVLFVKAAVLTEDLPGLNPKPTTLGPYSLRVYRAYGFTSFKF